MEEPQLLIDQYLNGELTNELLKDFELEMAQNQEFKKEVEFYRNTKVALENQDEIRNFKDLLPKLASENLQSHSTSERKIFSLKNGWMKVAAVILILAVAIPLLLMIRTTDSSESIFVQKQVSPESLKIEEDLLVSGSSDEMVKLWEESIEWYQKKDWEVAADGMKTLIRNGFHTEKVQLLLSNVYLEMEEYDEAIAILLPLSRMEIYQPEIAEPANWNLIQAYMKRGDNEKAIKHLKLLENSPEYGDHAKQLIDVIR